MGNNFYIPGYLIWHYGTPLAQCTHKWPTLLLHSSQQQVSFVAYWGEPERAPYKSVGGCTYVAYVRPYVSKNYVACKFLFQRLRVCAYMYCVPKSLRSHVEHLQKCLQIAGAMSNNEGKRTAV